MLTFFLIEKIKEETYGKEFLALGQENKVRKNRKAGELPSIRLKICSEKSQYSIICFINK